MKFFHAGGSLSPAPEVFYVTLTQWNKQASDQTNLTPCALSVQPKKTVSINMT